MKKIFSNITILIWLKFKKTLALLALFSFSLSFPQGKKQPPLVANFTYLMKAKLYKSRPAYVHEELFSLQVTGDRAFFVSENSLRFDSVFSREFQNAVNSGNGNIIDFRGKVIPKAKFRYTIIQSGGRVQYFENVGMSLLSYTEPAIGNWKLLDETRMINSFKCQKAELNYKGRTWVAWYAPDVALLYGPYKFSGLPGLIIKISDASGEYDFELIKSVPNSGLKGRLLSVNPRRYEGAMETNPEDMRKAKKNFIENIAGMPANSGTIIVSESANKLRDLQKQRQQDFYDQNPIELAK